MELDWSHVQAQFEALAGSEYMKGEGEAMSFEALVGGTSEDFEARISKARAYAQRLGTDAASSPNGHTFINGKYYALDDVCPAPTLSTELYLIAGGAELPEPAAIQSRTGTSVHPREGYRSVAILDCTLSASDEQLFFFGLDLHECNYGRSGGRHRKSFLRFAHHHEEAESSHRPTGQWRRRARD